VKVSRRKMSSFPLLYQWVDAGNFKQASLRLKSHPEEARIHCDLKSFARRIRPPLWVALERNAPLEFIHQLTVAYPAALVVLSAEPILHLAARRGHSAETLVCLLQCNPELVKQRNAAGLTAVEYVWSLLRNQPLFALLELQYRVANTSLIKVNNTPCNFLLDQECQYLWSSFKVLLKAQFNSSSTLHAVILGADTLPADVVQHIMRVELAHNEHLVKVGWLHLLAERSGMDPPDSSGEITPESNLVVFLKCLNPKTRATLAATCNAQGEVPLTVAIRNGVTWHRGLSDLLYACYSALSLPLWTTAAMESTTSLDTLYNLLLASPSILIQPGRQEQSCLGLQP